MTLRESMEKTIRTYESIRVAQAQGQSTDALPQGPKDIKWNRELSRDLASGKPTSFSMERITKSVYRPFVTEYCYFDRVWNAMVSQLPKYVVPGHEAPPMIVVSGVGSTTGFSCIMTKMLPNLDVVSKSQVLPLFWYEEPQLNGGLLDTLEQGLARREGISRWALDIFSSALGREVSREEIFYYCYGVLHSEDFREAYEDNLVKERPRIPMVKSVEDFDAFVKAGRELADLHLNYESVEQYPLEEVCTRPEVASGELYRVVKMTFPKGQAVKDRPSSIIYNSFIVLNGIPDEAWDYMLSGKAALYWIVDRYRLAIDKESGIVNDPNEYSDDPRYIIDLVKRIVSVSVKTMRIVRSLPSLSFD
jgi:predicted helicase